MTSRKSIIIKDDIKKQVQENKARQLLKKYLQVCTKIERLAIQNRARMQSIKRYERQFKKPSEVEM